MKNKNRDFITVKAEDGIEKHYTVEALFDMEDQTYALLESDDETVLMRVENENGEQYLVGLNNPEERNSILEAYQIAVEASQTGDLH